MTAVSDQSPSQAEGEREPEAPRTPDDSGRDTTGVVGPEGAGHPCPRHTPSQAEGDRGDDEAS